MKKIVYALVLMSMAFAACNKEPQSLTPAQVKQEIDSLTQAHIRESDRQAQKDLELRIKIEVKVKADSILKARLMGPPKEDTLRKRQLQLQVAPRRTLFK